MPVNMMSWYAIRTIYLFGSKADGTNVFEERVVCFGAESWDDAYQKARVESRNYAEANNFEAHSQQSGYEQDGDNLIDGYEVWSELFEARLSLEEFHDHRYSAFLYTPEASAKP